MSPKDCILITGAAGFIATALRKSIDSTLPIVGIDTFVVDVHPNGDADLDPTNLEAIYKGNLLDSGLINSVLADWNPKILLHLAAETGTGVSAIQQSRHVGNNSLATSALLESLERNGKIPETVILSSSRAVYGDGHWLNELGEIELASPRSLRDLTNKIWRPRSLSGEILSTYIPQSAKHAPNPANVYALTKYTQEKLVQYWCDRLGVKYQILRFQNVYGPGQSAHNPYTGIVNVFGNQGFKGLPISVFEDGEIVRDFIFIDDIVEGLKSLTSRPLETSGVYDLGSGVATTISQLAELVSNMTNSPKPEISGQFRHGDVRAAVADTDTLLPNWQPKTSLSEGIERTLEWLKLQET